MAWLSTWRSGGLPHRWLALVLTLSLGATLVLPAFQARAEGAPSVGLGPSAQLTSPEPGTGTGALTDGRPTAVRDGVGANWTAPARQGAWVQFAWSQPKSITAVQIYGAAGVGARIRSGLLTFGDGTSLEVGEILGDPAFPTTLAFPARTVSSVRFTVTGIAGSGSIGLAEMRVYPVGATPLRYGSPSA